MFNLLEWIKSANIQTLISCAALIRLILIGYGQHHDVVSEVKYTDIDYTVFTDAARYVHEGESPYRRLTYRYSPLIAILLTPNIFLTPLFGKILFSCMDILAGYLIYLISRQQIGGDEGMSKIAALAWLFNPLVMNISTRGSAESLIIVTVLLTIFFYNQKLYILSGIFYGLSIHLKIYPIVYCLALYNPLTDKSGVLSLLHLSRPRMRLVLSTVVTLILLTVTFYNQYGEIFLEEAYFYHFTRKDIRHNFSVYFYMLYLTVEFDDIGLNIMTFLPQLILLLAITHRFHNIYELNFCLFCLTVVFVTFNKVVTAQYFVWYFCLLPLVAPSLRLTKKQIILGSILWGFAQSSWLLPAYLLEFKGSNTYMFIWLESLAFFSANIGILAKLIRKHKEVINTINAECDIKKLD
eukprot:TRINITY_DN17034_c0_g1_i1.p1 TRINITY_DN17034_c0_g1~~TRINITY_DN17034_c0_g1_i1.p1  ORF type:complete len:409 (+),score=50.51 TRINITY_DN17034_c0_g1_i1:44-1270(+)